MTLVYTIAALVAASLCAYLVVALLRPEWFE
jgi:K+-transporting ATPase KdpF subunit